MQIQQVLAAMRTLSAQATRSEAGNGETAAAGFGEVLRQSLEQVNQAQAQADTLATRFTAGDPGVDLPEVMVAVQKAGLQFEAVTQVRNRLIAAYQEIMNMQA